LDEIFTIEQLNKKYIVFEISIKEIMNNYDMIKKIIRNIYHYYRTEIKIISLTPWQGDLTWLDKLSEEVNDFCFCSHIKPKNLLEATTIIGNSLIYFGNSLHGLITAVAYKKPAVIIKPWENHKYKGFINACGINTNSIINNILFNSWDELLNYDFNVEIIEIEDIVKKKIKYHWEEIIEKLNNQNNKLKYTKFNKFVEKESFSLYKKGINYGLLINYLELTSKENNKLGKWGQDLDRENKEKDILLIQRQEEIERLAEWGKRLDRENQEKDKLIQSRQEEIERLAEWGKTLNRENQEKDKLIQSRQEEIERLAKWGKSLDEELKKKIFLIEQKDYSIKQKDFLLLKRQEEIERLAEWGKTLDRENREKDLLLLKRQEEIEKLGKWGQGLDRENQEKNILIFKKQDELEYQKNLIDNKDKELVEKQELIEKQNNELVKIYKSKFWKVKCFLEKKRNLLFLKSEKNKKENID